jgi:AmiR/NasT family two-component response regulator
MDDLQRHYNVGVARFHCDGSRRGLRVPIVAMSGGSGTLSETDHLEYARNLGAAAIVDKPFRASHLAEVIDRATSRPRFAAAADLTDRAGIRIKALNGKRNVKAPAVWPARAIQTRLMSMSERESDCEELSSA